MLSKLAIGDTPSWRDDAFVDDKGVTYDSANYALTYVLAGPPATPVSLTATASGSGWVTSLSSAVSLALVAGTYWWSKVLTKTGFRATVAQGQLIVTPNLATLSATYDGRTLAQKALADAETAFATFGSSGSVKSYTIGNRQMTFHDLKEIKAQVDYWRAKVVAEEFAANGGKNRNIRMRFQRAN